MLVEHRALDFPDHDPGPEVAGREHALPDMGGADAQESGEPLAVGFEDGGLSGRHGGGANSTGA